MKKTFTCFVIFAALMLATPVAFAAASKDPDAKVKREMIKRSIENYKGPCPCPFSKDENGKFCGKKSAYDAPPWGETPPLCYFENINAEMIAEYLKEKGEVKEKPKPKQPAKPKTGGG